MEKHKKKSGFLVVGAIAIATLTITTIGTLVALVGVPPVAGLCFYLDQNAKRRKSDLQAAKIQNATWYKERQVARSCSARSKTIEGAN